MASKIGSGIGGSVLSGLQALPSRESFPPRLQHWFALKDPPLGRGKQLPMMLERGPCRIEDLFIRAEQLNQKLGICSRVRHTFVVGTSLNPKKELSPNRALQSRCGRFHQLGLPQLHVWPRSSPPRPRVFGLTNPAARTLSTTGNVQRPSVHDPLRILNQSLG